MLNEIILVGRLTNNIVVNTTDKGKKIGNLTLAVPRSFKNMDGLYETDFIPCLLWEEKATLAKDYCHTGDIVGNKSKRYTDKVQIIIALFINDFKGIFFFVISDMIK